MALMLRMYGEGAGAPGHKSVRHAEKVSTHSRALASALAATLIAGALGGCASSSGPVATSVSGQPMFPESKWGVSASRRVAGENERIQKGGGVYKTGAPYKVGGRWYNPREQPDYDRIGTASWYGSDFHGRHTANGEVFDMNALTAAHPTLPLPSYAYVTNLSNNRTVLVRVNDRGPYVGDRMIDLSRASARALGLLSGGTGKVRVRYAGPAPMDGNDARERQFLATRGWAGGTEIADLESARSLQESTAVRRTAELDRAPGWQPPREPMDAPQDRQPNPMQRPDMAMMSQPPPRRYAEASPPASPEMWSPERYRAALSNR